ncbi:prephenate/arogenate dehydrogenase family protein [Pleomorphomonas sp. NRK KF1]|uniref:prephenate/arogenate dehydrogenase family protein n=1 Tax=Pleomorphomonas sp. NRK KF1 TaxID=2943000 RepID=UPI002043310C|nr:prephenate/arogenate dehydrogenase family protein [Pleomorphomonas sp. NRK KF1]MCM5554431.1 prephenate/arogenate dehydrogenase family protein [Pleomorphomonas sp. NRK KF1]
MTDAVFHRLAIIGIGLIGSSIARAARLNGLVDEIVISDQSPVILKRAEELTLGDSYCDNAGDAVVDADLVIACVPVGAAEAIAKAIAPHLKPGAVVSDVGSVKGSVVRQMKPYLPANVHFIPAHPVAGTEYSGPDAGFPELFVNRWSIVCPDEDTDPKALDRLVAFWAGMGANVECMSAERHDLVLAITSHLPHLIAYNIVGTAADLEKVTESEVMKFSAGGFRDFTRIAASDPTMWRDVFLHNKDAVLEVLGRFQEDLFALQRQIRWGEGDRLYDLFSRTRSIRRGILTLGQDAPEADFGRSHKAQPKPPSE